MSSKKLKYYLHLERPPTRGVLLLLVLEMAQNSLRYNWTRNEVDEKLKDIMMDIHDSCIEYGSTDDGYVDYVKGANIAGFVKVADAMLAQGVV